MKVRYDANKEVVGECEHCGEILEWNEVGKTGYKGSQPDGIPTYYCKECCRGE